MRRRKDPFEKPWVIIAAVAGIIAVVVIGLIFFTESGSPAPSGSSGQPSAASPGSAQTVAAGMAPSVIKTQTPVVVPQEGVYIKVSYLGGFAGTYGMEGNITSTRNSGDRVFIVEDAAGEVTATFHKEDSSQHEITVEIWKDGNVLQSAKNSSAFGEASVISAV